MVMVSYLMYEITKKKKYSMTSADHTQSRCIIKNKDYSSLIQMQFRFNKLIREKYWKRVLKLKSFILYQHLDDATANCLEEKSRPII